MDRDGNRGHVSAMPQRRADIPRTHGPDKTRLASAAVILGGALWGLYWLPLRLLSGPDLQGAWPGVLIFSGAVLVVLPVAFARLRNLTAIWRPLALAGLLTGAAFSFYSTSLMMTEVVRSLLLFYLTPIWGTILGMIFLGERLTRARVLAIGLALAGLVAVIGVGGMARQPPNIGDALALASGLCWAFGSLSLYRLSRAGIWDLVLAFAVGSLVVTLATLAVAGDALGAVPGREIVTKSIVPAVIIGILVIPMLALTVWPTTILTPGRVGMLLLSEALVGVISAAILSGEPFGWREVLGTTLIVSAAAVEVLSPKALR